eukprot:jgi/Galph1/5546/GphlegSOOS_G4137.1
MAPTTCEKNYPSEAFFILCLSPGSFRRKLAPLKFRANPETLGVDGGRLEWKWSKYAYIVSHTDLLNNGGTKCYIFVDKSLDNLDIHIDMTVRNKENGEDKNSLTSVTLGRCALVSSEFLELKGVIRRPITNKESNIIGEIVFEFLVVECVAATCPKNGVHCALLIGHRGKGAHVRSFVQENTLLSFLSATRDRKVKCIELDVQLTADGHPIVFHDFLITRKTQQLDLDDMDAINAVHHPTIAVGSLTLKKFQKMGVFREVSTVVSYESDRDSRDNNGHYPRSKGYHNGRRVGNKSCSTSRSSSITSDLSTTSSGKAYDFEEEEAEEVPSLIEDHLPSLEEVCMKMPVDVGFFLELKYPCPEYQERKRLALPERNFFVNAVLDCVLCSEEAEDGCIFVIRSRYLLFIEMQAEMFSSFVVMFGARFPSDDRFDPRTIDIHAAIDWAVAQNLDGMVILADIILEKPFLVSQVKNYGLWVFCFGSVNSQVDQAKELIALGVDGLIADNVTTLARDLYPA